MSVEELKNEGDFEKWMKKRGDDRWRSTCDSKSFFDYKTCLPQKIQSIRTLM